MEGGDNILHAIYDEDNLDDLDDDVEMMDVEEGELVEHDSQHVLGESSAGDINIATQESLSKNRKRRANKKKNKRKRKGSRSNGFDINRSLSANLDFSGVLLGPISEFFYPFGCLVYMYIEELRISLS